MAQFYAKAGIFAPENSAEAQLKRMTEKFNAEAARVKELEERVERQKKTIAQLSQQKPSSELPSPH